MKRSTGALLFSLVSAVGVALVWTRVLPALGGAIGAVVIGFVGSFLGFVAAGDGARRRDNVVAWTGAILGSLAVLVGCGLFLATLLASGGGR